MFRGSYPVPSMLDDIAHFGSTFVRGRVRIYARMRVAAQHGWGRDLKLQILIVFCG